MRRDVIAPPGERLGRSFEGFSYVKQTLTSAGKAPTLTSAGKAPTPILAWRLADEACTARDSNPAKFQSTFHPQLRGSTLLSSHFQATVVSPLFFGLDQSARLGLLVDAIFTTQKRDSTEESFQNSSSHADFLGCSQIALKLMTPVQRLLQVRPVIVAATTRAQEADSPSFVRNLLNENISSGRSKRPARTARRVGHFFYSLPAEHQRFVLVKQRRATEILQRAQNNAGVRTDTCNDQTIPSLTKNSTGVLMVSVLSRTLRDPIKQRRQNAVLAAWLAVNNKHKAQLAIRLQRIYRSSTLVRALLQHKERNVAVVNIQRIVRGRFGSFFASFLTRVAGIAATFIAARYRAVIVARNSKTRHNMRHTAVVQIQTLIRLQHARWYLAWMQQNWCHASNINLWARQFLVHCQHEVFAAIAFQIERTDSSRAPGKYDTKLLPSVAEMRIAARLKGAHYRSRVLRVLSAEFDRKIIHPAGSLILRVARGQIGRRVALYVAQQFKGAIDIQRVARSFMKVAWRKRTYIARLETRSLMQLQRFARGHLDRIFVRLKRSETWRIRLHMVLLPRLQAGVRRIVAKHTAKYRVITMNSSTQIQSSWRQFSLQKAAKDAYHLQLLHIQAGATTRLTQQVRGRIARKYYLSMRHAIAGDRFKAVRIILRAWLRYHSVLRFALLKQEWEVENSTKTLMAWHSLRTEIRLDMAHVRADLRGARTWRRWTRKRLRVLGNFIMEAELRLPKIESQVLALGVIDVESGWREALQNEWQRLTAQLAMAKEEKRIMKIQAGRFNALLIDLQLEYEDFEIDIDDIAVREQQEFELLRRLEITRADAHAASYRQERIRHERMRWRVRDVRTCILKRGRKIMAGSLGETFTRREIDASSTISVSRRQKILHDALREASKNDHARRAAARESASADKAGSISKVRATYETVLSGCAILQCQREQTHATSSSCPT